MRKEFASVWRKLRRALPTRRPARVRFVAMETLKRYHRTTKTVYGDYDQSTGTIRIALAICADAAIDALLHEYAHHLSRRQGHGDAWAKAYARCYRAVYEQEGTHT